ncbi:hypothetical protein A3C86_03810 [Candidatus Kaiserbacteria bacterium RIFCSPHIGHO2_02_FULL_49_16]|uniref:Uncharacterized protein n=1 Tax=Candidatus Kaiserbacteria bacterium RIFCSPHIGHO2_02_FULL_49_16 TaxID=1798490 RepID=A0A1F6DA48_9BACT|nr:MAG: hypothetical protein A3C86_03810 [Candidatus Kaiserbacteria bacterium RIFCSPHIGHO2_02_FULL_49_16]
MAQNNDRNKFLDLLHRAIMFWKPVQPTFETTRQEKNADCNDTQTRSHKTAGADEKPNDKSPE